MSRNPAHRNWHKQEGDSKYMIAGDWDRDGPDLGFRNHRLYYPERETPRDEAKQVEPKKAT